MCLTKLAPSGWAYFAEEIATGREDYYAASAERPGRYLGRGTAAIGLTGEEVSALGLERLIGHGADPRVGRAFGRPYPPDERGVVAGFGLTFSPPKTVSVLWGCGDKDVAGKVLAAHETAVDTALSFLEDHAAFTRRGAGGLYQVDTEGFVAVSFIHRTSRAADPQLHTHVLVANKVRAADGAWRSLDARELYEHQKAAGMLYKAALRAELSSCLRVVWTPVDKNGIAEIELVPQVLVQTWSSRRHAVESLGNDLAATRETELGRELTDGERAICFQLAAYRTRSPKIDAETPTPDLMARWRDEAISWGEEPERWLTQVLDQKREAAPERPGEIVTRAIARLQDSTATWGRSDVVEVLTTLVAGPSAEEVRARVELLADSVLGDHRVCSLVAPLPGEPPTALQRRDQMSAIERHGAIRYTSQVTLQREARVLDIVANGHSAHVGVVPRAITEPVLSSSVLGGDQQTAVRELVSGGEQVALLVGPAGAGKSRALEAARQAWQLAGYRPIGLAPSAMAAAVLQDQAGLSSETLAKFLLELEREAMSRLDEATVVVLDEAAMARTDDLEKLLAAATRARSKVVLVGDPNQLGAVGPGGLFATLVSDHGASELETVRRFEHTWEAQASLRLRARDSGVLLEYFDRGRIVGGSRETMHQAAFTAWRTARDDNKSVLVMASDNETVNKFALACREDRVARGEVESGGVRLANGRAGIGDEIVTLKNDRRLRPSRDDFVRNGERWRVIERDESGALRVASLDGRVNVVLPAGYVAEHVALAYALTVHKAQGATTDRAIVLVDAAMTAQQLYVAMSRGREENRAFVERDHIDLNSHHFERIGRPSTIEVLANVMRHDGAEHSAHDVLRENFARLDDLGLLRHLLTEARYDLQEGAGPDHRKEIAVLEPRANVQRAYQHANAAEGAARRAEVRRSKAEAGLKRAEHPPLRTLLPGPLGNDARREANAEWRNAKANLADARRAENEALRDYERDRHGIEEAKQAAHELTDLRAWQEQREGWLASHPDAQRWVLQLEVRVQSREREIESADRDEIEPDETYRTSSPPNAWPAKKGEIEREERTGKKVEQEATQRLWPERDLGYIHAPERLPSPERGGPVLGR